MSIYKIFGSLGKYGGLPGLILGLVVVLVLALIYKDTLNRTVFKLAGWVIGILLVIAIVILGVQIWRGSGVSSVDNQPKGPPPIEAPQTKKTERSRPPPPAPEVVEVSGSVTPIPKQPAHISIEGVTGEWPIDASGKFSFKVPGGRRQVRIIVADGVHQPQSGYYFLSGEPLSISLKQ